MKLQTPRALGSGTGVPLTIPALSGHRSPMGRAISELDHAKHGSP
jgi:hypothetical protein